MSQNQDGVPIWNKFLLGAMNMPGVKVNRKEFLYGKLSNYLEGRKLDDAINKSPVGIVDLQLLDRLADSVISSHTTKVTALSTVAGIPGGFAMVGTVPADIAQYYYHVLSVAQKLAYIYGWPDLLDEKGNLKEDSLDEITLFVGVMSGVAAANEGLNQLGRMFAKQVAERLPKMALTKTTIYPIVKQVAKWLGISMTKSTFAKGLSKVVPVISGLISGGLTYVTFKPSAKKLKKKLKEESSLFKVDNMCNEKEAEDVDYENVE